MKMHTERPDKNSGEEQKTILLVEDEALIALGKKQVLEKLGYKVITALNGQKALEIIESASSVDLILMDIDLGSGMDGTETARLILQHHEIPLVFLSSHAEPEIVEKTEGITSYGYIIKDSKETVLHASIKMAFRLFEAKVKEKEKERAFFESEIRYRTLFDTAGHSFLILDGERIIDCNKASVTLFKSRDKSGILDHSFFDFSPKYQPGGANSAETGTAYIDMALQGRPQQFFWQYRRRDGTAFEADVSFTVLIQDDKSYIQASIRDITQQRLADLALQKSESILKSTLESMNDGILIIDVEGKITHSNTRFQQIFSIPQELLATGDDELLINFVKGQLQDPEGFTHRIDELYRSASTAEDLLRFRDGRLVERRSYPLAEGSPVEGRAWIFRDMTEQKRNEDILQMFKYSIDKSMDAVIWLNEKGGFDYVNEQFCRSLGYTQDELMKRNIFDIDTVFSKERFEEVWAGYQRDRTEGSLRIETLQKRKDGSLFPVEVEVNHIWFGERLLHVTHMHDITERKRAEEKVAHLNQVLLAIRNVNQLIIREKDLEHLIKKACETLIETHGYYTAWIALFDEAGHMTFFADAGLKDGSETLSAMLEGDEIPACGRRALSRSDVVVMDDSADEYVGGTLLESVDRSERSGLTVRLEHDGIVYGLLTVSVPPHFIVDENEIALFREVAGDLSLAIHTIQGETHIRRLERIVSSLPHLVAFVSRDFRYLDVNDIYCTFFDTTRDKIVGRKIVDLIGKKKFETELKPHLERCLSGEPRLFELCMDFPGKGKRWVQMEYYPYREKNGEITAVVASGLDITDRKRMEDELLESEELFKTVFEMAPVGIVQIALDGRFKKVNSRFCDIVGYTSDELSALTFEDITYPDDLNKEHESIARVLSGETDSYEIEKRYIHKTGRIVWIKLFSKVIRDEKGGLKYIFAAVMDITERKQAEERIIRFSRIFEDSLNEIYIFDADTLQFVELNKAAEQNLGYSPDEYTQMTPLDIKPLLTAESFEELIQPLRSGEEESVVFETVHMRKDRSLYDVEVHLQLLKYEPKEIFVAIILDIMEKKKAEKELMEREENFILAQDLADIGSWRYDIEADELYWSDGLRRIYGIGPEFKLEIENVFEWMHPDDRPHSRQKMRRAVEEGIPFEIEFRFMRSSGELRTLRGVGKVERNEEGKSRFVYGTAQDITGFRQAEEKIGEAYEIINKSPAVAFLWRNEAGRPVDYVSENVAGLAGYTAEEFLAGEISYNDIIHPEDLGRVAGDVRIYSNDKETSAFSQVYRIVAKDGTVKWLDDHSWIRRNEEGEITHYQGVVLDISERRAAEDEIKRQLSEKEVLLKEVHHRIKNHIATIGGLLSFQAESVRDAEARTAFQSAIGRVNSMSVLYDKLLLSGEYKDISVRNYLEELIGTILEVFPDTVKLIIQKQLDDFQLSLKRLFPLGVIINELLTNAIKYAFAGRETGTIHITLRREDRRATLTVRDDGLGLKDDFDLSTSKGFGLMLVKMLTEQIGGTFTIESREGTANIVSFDL